MKNKIKDYWYSLGDSTRAKIVFLGWMLIFTGAITSLFIQPLVLTVILGVFCTSLILWMFYMLYQVIKTSEEDKHSEYIYRKRRGKNGGRD